MKVTIYGCGYVGLVGAACLAEVANDVLLIDVETHTIQTLTPGGLTRYGRGPESRNNSTLRRFCRRFFVRRGRPTTGGCSFRR